MDTESITSKLYHFINLLFICATLNILFILGMFMGGIIFGIGPSFMSTHQLAKDYFQGKWNKPVRKFIDYYKKSFKIANKIFLPVLSWIVILIFDIFILNSNNWIDLPLVSFLFTIVIIIGSAYITLIGPLFTFYELTIKKFHPVGFRYALRNIAPLILGLAWLGICIAGSAVLPGLIPFYSFGIWIFVNEALYLQIFERNEKLLEKQI